MGGRVHPQSSRPCNPIPKCCTMSRTPERIGLDAFETRLAEAEARDADSLWEQAHSSPSRSSVSFSTSPHDNERRRKNGSPSSRSSSPSSSPASSRASSKSSRSSKRRGPWRKAKSSVNTWKVSESSPPPVAASYEPSGLPPVRGSTAWIERAANLARRWPDVHAEVIDTALTLTNGHAGEAGAEITRLTGRQPVAFANMPAVGLQGTAPPFLWGTSG